MNSNVAVQIAIQANVPTIWWEEPGVGKTSIIHEFSEAMNWPMEVLILSTCDPTEVGGMPIVTTDGYQRSVSKRIKDLIAKTEEVGGGILFLDELPTAPPATQAAALRVTQADPYGYRWMGDTRLPKELRVVAAGNPTEHSAGGWELTAPLANRFYHHTGRPTADEWIKGMRSGFDKLDLARIPDNWREHLGMYRGYVASFIRARRALLLSVPKDEASTGKAWPSPRTWDMSATLLAASHVYGQEVQSQLLSGTVGEGATAEYISWFVNLDLPTVEEVFKNPKLLDSFTKDQEHRIYALLSSVCAYVKEHPTKTNWDNMWKVLIKCGTFGADIVFAFVPDLDELKSNIKGGNVSVPDAGKKMLERIGRKSGVKS